MIIGITYDLRKDYLSQGFGKEETAEFDRIETVNAIDDALRSLGFKTVRIGCMMNLLARLNAGERWDLVFNIAEGIYGAGRESQVPALLDAFHIPYTFSDPVVLGLSLNKGLTKRVVRDLGVPTPDFYVVENIEDIKNVNISFPLFAKPIAEGTSKGINSFSFINDETTLEAVCSNLLERFVQPVIVEEFLPGREFTVGILGTGPSARTIGVLEVILLEKAEGNAYSYLNKSNYWGKVDYRLADDKEARLASEMALKVWRGLGCRDGGRMDFRCDAKGMPNFIEVNPLAGLDPELSDLIILARKKGIEYKELISLIVASALERVKSTPQVQPPAFTLPLSHTANPINVPLQMQV